MEHKHYCQMCGEDITCPTCKGTGILEKFPTKEPVKNFCCGSIRIGKYCPECGKQLNHFGKEVHIEICYLCKGYGTTFHACSKGLL